MQFDALGVGVPDVLRALGSLCRVESTELEAEAANWEGKAVEIANAVFRMRLGREGAK